MAWAEYVGLQQYAWKYPRSDMPSVHGIMVLFVCTGNYLGRLYSLGIFRRREAALPPIPEEGREKRKRMTKLQIISKLWSAIYDLVFLVKGTPTKSLEEIEADLDIVEYACRKYADCDDDEITFESRGGIRAEPRK